jgi:hypothetical protein
MNKPETRTAEVQIAGRTLQLAPLDDALVGRFIAVCFRLGKDGGKPRTEGYFADLAEVLTYIWQSALEHHPQLELKELTDRTTDVELTKATVALGLLTMEHFHFPLGGNRNG